jgi:rod shape-determining protein MreC
MVVGLLVVLSLVLITVSYRSGEGSAVDRAQDAAASVLHPFEVAAERVARPFRDAYGWFESLFDARSEAERLREENERLRQAAISNAFAVEENRRLKALLDYRSGPTFPEDYRGLSAAVISAPTGAFAQSVVVAVGRNDGVRLNSPVVTEDGLVGLVTRVNSRSSLVTLLTDEQSAVSAVDIATDADGVVRHGRGVGSTLILDRVSKADDVREGDTIVTSGWRTSRLESLFPRGLQIGRVTSVGQTDTDLYKQVQVEPFASFSSLDSVVVLVRKDPGAR